MFCFLVCIFKVQTSNFHIRFPLTIFTHTHTHTHICTKVKPSTETTTVQIVVVNMEADTAPSSKVYLYLSVCNNLSIQKVLLQTKTKFYVCKGSFKLKCKWPTLPMNKTPRYITHTTRCKITKYNIQKLFWFQLHTQHHWDVANWKTMLSTTMLKQMVHKCNRQTNQQSHWVDHVETIRPQE